MNIVIIVETGDCDAIKLSLLLAKFPSIKSIVRHNSYFIEIHAKNDLECNIKCTQRLKISLNVLHKTNTYTRRGFIQGILGN